MMFKLIQITVILNLIACGLLPQSWTRKDYFGPDDLKSDGPVIQIKALRQFVEEKKTDYIAYIIPLLNDEDITVRTQAYWALKNLIPKYVKYPKYNPNNHEELRLKSIKKWNTWWSANKDENWAKTHE